MAMNRIINNADLVVEDMLKGWLLAHADTVVGTDNSRVVKRARAPEAGKVGIVTGGGSGHEPAFLGYVGDGMVDAVAIGEIFSSPTAKSFLDAMRAANGGAGVACLYGNYAGDNMNVKMAMAMAEREGIAVKTVVANDDVPSAPKGEEAKRRGVAGEILMWKVGAAKAAMGGSLDEVISAYQQHGIHGCIITKVDEAASLATSLDVIIRHDLPLHYVSNGQRVPEDLHLPNRTYLLHRAFKDLPESSPHRLGGLEPGLMMASASEMVAAGGRRG